MCLRQAQVACVAVLQQHGTHTQRDAKAGAPRSCQLGPCQVDSCTLESCQFGSGHIWSGQVESFHFGSCQIRSYQLCVQTLVVSGRVGSSRCARWFVRC